MLSLQVCSRSHCWSQTQLTLSFILHKKLTPFRAGSNLACGVKNKFTVFWLEVGLSASQEACVARLWVEKPDQSEGEWRTLSPVFLSDFLATPHLGGDILFIFKNYEWVTIRELGSHRSLPGFYQSAHQSDEENSVNIERREGSLDQETKKNLEVGSGLKFSIRTLKIDACGYRNGSVLLLDKPQEADAWAVEMNTIFETITYYLGIRVECFKGHTQQSLHPPGSSETLQAFAELDLRIQGLSPRRL